MTSSKCSYKVTIRSSPIIQLWTMVIKVKENYKNGYNNQPCRACKMELEIQQHVLETCPELHRNPSIITLKSEIFEENIDNLRNIATKLENIQKAVEKFNLTTK